MTKEAKILAGLFVGTIALMVFGAVLLGRGGSQTPSVAEQTLSTDELVLSDSPKKGPDNAKMTLVEFTDYQCPACGGQEPIVKKFVEDFPNDARLVIRHFPLSSIHKNARVAAQAVEASGKQGKYWEMHAILFENQKEWSDLSNPVDKFIEYAKSISLNEEQFKKDINDDSVFSKIKRDEEDANRFNLTSTPTFFINGKKYAQFFTYDELKKILESL